MMDRAPWYRIACVLTLPLLTASASAQGTPPLGGREAPDLSIELIDPNVLRVCADPHNMPFSNEKGEGFENKLAQLFADKLQKKLAYAFFPQATGFVRMTLG